MFFDFKTAWREVAKPAFDALPQHIRDLVDRVQELCSTTHQSHDLSLPWPKDGGEMLQVAFEGLSSEQLATASRVVYFFGHWAQSAQVQQGGAYWKFALYADQVLSKRLGFPGPHEMPRVNGTSYRIHQGVLRVNLISPNSSGWVELGPATEQTRELRLQQAWPAQPTLVASSYADDKAFAAHYRAWHEWEKSCSHLASVVRDQAWPKDGPLGLFRDIERFIKATPA